MFDRWAEAKCHGLNGSVRAGEPNLVRCRAKWFADQQTGAPIYTDSDR